MNDLTEEELEHRKNQLGMELLKVEIGRPRKGFEEQRNFLIHRAKNYLNNNEFAMCEKLIGELKLLVIPQ